MEKQHACKGTTFIYSHNDTTENDDSVVTIIMGSTRATDLSSQSVDSLNSKRKVVHIGLAELYD